MWRTWCERTEQEAAAATATIATTAASAGDGVAKETTQVEVTAVAVAAGGDEPAVGCGTEVRAAAAARDDGPWGPRTASGAGAERSAGSASMSERLSDRAGGNGEARMSTYEDVSGVGTMTDVADDEGEGEGEGSVEGGGRCFGLRRRISSETGAGTPPQADQQEEHAEPRWGSAEAVEAEARQPDGGESSTGRGEDSGSEGGAVAAARAAAAQQAGSGVGPSRHGRAPRLSTGGQSRGGESTRDLPVKRVQQSATQGEAPARSQRRHLLGPETRSSEAADREQRAAAERAGSAGAAAVTDSDDVAPHPQPGSCAGAAAALPIQHHGAPQCVPAGGSAEAAGAGDALKAGAGGAQQRRRQGSAADARMTAG